MLEFIPLILILLLADLYPLGIEPLFFDPWLTCAGTLLLSAGLGLTAKLGLLFASRQMRASGDMLRFYRRLTIGSLTLRGALLAAYALELFVLHWPLFVAETLRLDGWLLIEPLLVMAPALAKLTLLWIAQYPIDRAGRGASWTLWQSIDFRARVGLGTVLLPVLAMSTALGAAARIPGVEQAIVLRPYLEIGVAGVVAVLVFLGAPALLRRVWRAQPLPAGPLRTRLEAVARQAGFRYRDLLVWHTRGGRLANALIVGLIGPMRYVIFTDALLERLSTEETAAVFGHEIGHARYHHLPCYLVFALSLGVVMAFANAVVGPWIRPEVLGATVSEFVTPVLLLLLLAALYFLFSFVSRRFERQADLFGAELIGNPEVFAAALERVSAMSGTPRSAANWRYFSIEQRVREVLEARYVVGAAARLRRSAQRVFLLLAMFYAVAVCGGLRMAWAEEQRVPQRARLWRAVELAQQAWQDAQDGRIGLALQEIEAALVEDAGRSPVWFVYGEILDAHGRSEDARAAFARAVALGGLGPRELIHLQRRDAEPARPELDPEK